MNNSIRVFANIAILLALYYLIYYVYCGFLHPIPAPGDSFDYHIPISESILNGSFLHLTHARIGQWYYPGSSEAINALFILLHIPLTISNILPTIVLFLSLVTLARTFTLSKYYAILYAAGFVTINAVMRWQNAVSIDMWVAVFFTLALMLLEKPKKNIFYFGKLGFVLGMLIGSKYTTIYFLILFLFFYGKKLTRYLSIKNSIAFLIPFSIFGLFWYIRNYFLTGNPFYPLKILFFNGPIVFTDTIFNELLRQPFAMINAAYGEYHLWILSIVAGAGFILYWFFSKKQFHLPIEGKLFLIGMLLFLLFLTFPTSEQPWIMVSSFRYSYPAFIPLILGCFIVAQKYKKEELLGYLTIANSLYGLTMTFYPKLLLVTLVVFSFVLYLNQRYWVKLK